MKIAITHRPDDAYIEKAWKHAAMAEAEDNSAKVLRKYQEGESIEGDFFSILYLAFRPGFKTGIG